MQSLQWVAALCGLTTALATSAQPRVDDPADPATPAAPLQYRSAFDGYRPLGEAGIGNWREVNDRVRDAAAAAEAAIRAKGQGAAATPAAPATPGRPAPTSSAAPATGIAPAPAGHGHHGAPR